MHSFKSSFVAVKGTFLINTVFPSVTSLEMTLGFFASGSTITESFSSDSDSDSSSLSSSSLLSLSLSESSFSDLTSSSLSDSSLISHTSSDGSSFISIGSSLTSFGSFFIISFKFLTYVFLAIAQSQIIGRPKKSFPDR